MAQLQGQHCESCGRSDPATDEGYTSCCNELVCWGDRSSTFTVEYDDGTTNKHVRSCCWAAIDAATTKEIVGGHRNF